MKATTTTTEATTTETEATTTETEATFINKHFTAYKVAVDEEKSLTLYKLKNYTVSYITDIANLTVYFKTSDDILKYLKTRLEATKKTSSEATVKNWLSYYKPLQELALQEYKKIFISFDIKLQFDLSCGGQVVLVSPSDADGIVIKNNIFTRPILKVTKENKKTMKAALNKHLTALQSALLSDSNAKIKKQVANLLALWQYDLSFMSVDAEGIKYLKNLGCLVGAKGDRHNQSKTTLLNKVVECVYTRRKRINTNDANNTDNTENN